MPGSGDAVQALKAGIMEIPDVIAINKLDHPLAAALETDVRQVLALGRGEPPPIVLHRGARAARGSAELWAAIEAHLAALRGRRRARASAARRTSPPRCSRSPPHGPADISRMRSRRTRAALGCSSEVRRRELDPLTAVHEILRKGVPD